MSVEGACDGRDGPWIKLEHGKYPESRVDIFAPGWGRITDCLWNGSDWERNEPVVRRTDIFADVLGTVTLHVMPTHYVPIPKGPPLPVGRVRGRE